MRPLFSLLLILCAGSRMMAQSSYRLGALSGINLNKNISTDWELNFQAEARHLFKERSVEEESPLTYTYVHTDLSAGVARKTGLNNTVAAGYQLRIREQLLIHRTAQQFTIARSYSTYRLAHRFAADQTFSGEEATEIRFRYRLTFEIPLNGQVVDPEEFYFKLNNEGLHNFRSSAYDLEFRTVPSFGYVFTDTNKLELGLDYRVDGFINGPSRHTLRLRLQWYIKLQ